MKPLIKQSLALALSLLHCAAAKEQFSDSKSIIAAVDVEDMDEVSVHEHIPFHTPNLRSSAKEANRIKCPFKVEERNVRNRHLKKGKSKKKNTILLYQDDFQEGSYRITEPGTYKLGEDKEFGPQKNNDYWPTFDLWSKYPPSAYYLGFFAAITIESDDVVIDLGGLSLRQSDEFYLLQRFFNAIELNDRVFVQNNGVSSLNYQKTDEPIGGLPAGSIVKPVNVEIKNGSIGKSSHSGIHGNGVIGLKISDVKIIEFEVSGIHCNGCKQVEVSNCEIGPSMQEVPVLGTFSNARFLEFFTKTLIPYGFEREPSGFKEALLQLFNDTISFSDRPDSEVSTLQSVFERLSRALQLFRLNLFNQTIPTTETDILLLEEAKSIFENPMGLPDGSVLYGIVLNRFGFPETDENFFGAGRETEDVNLRNIKITGLHAAPLEVAALITKDQTFMQGPARDLIRIFDITSDQMRSLGGSYYKGNFLSDVYFALWKLSNEFYKIRVFDSECGNFGSNATFDMNLKLYPSYDKQTCAQLGVKSDEALSGREVTMLQKRYFGGLQMTQDFFEWGTTSKRGLDSLLTSPESADNLRRKRHKLVCDHDTMFHPMHGVVGLKIVEAKNVKVANVDITDLHNKVDFTSWVCNHKWQIQPSGENIMPTKLSLGTPQSSTVRGVEVVRSDEVSFRNIQIKHLTSDEGIVKAIDIVGDDNDRSDHKDDEGVSFRKVSVGFLSGAISAKPFESNASPLTISGIEYEDLEEIDSSLKTPRVIINYQAVNAGPPIPVDPSRSNPVDVMMMTTELDTEEKIRAFRQEVLDFFTSQYGMQFDENASEKTSLFDIISVRDKDGRLTDSFVSGLSMIDNTSFQYHGSSICISDGRGQSSTCSNSTKSPVHDFSFSFVTGKSGYTFHGVFGSDQGQYSPPGNYIACGIYSFEGLKVPGYDEESNVMVKYFGECPIDLRPIKTQGLQSMYINCALESNIFGKGVATGIIVYDFINYLTIIDNVPVPKVTAYPTMIFDDYNPHPKPLVTKTNLQSQLIPYMQSNNVRFTFVADGTYNRRLSAIEALPYSKVHHYTHEAVLEFFKRRTSLTEDEDILGIRKSFLSRLRDEFFISAVGNIDDYDEIPLDGVIDLGGGNKIVGYAVNEYGNQRVLMKQGLPGDPAVVMPEGSRLHEGGFRLVVGRSGIDSIDGRLPFGTTIMQGIYILENGNPDGSDSQINFHSLGVVDLNSWSTSVVFQYLHHDVYGEGRLLAAQPMPKVDERGIHLKVCGVLIFGNV